MTAGPYTGGSAASKEPHWMQDESWLREMQHDERESYLQRLEDESPRPSYGGTGRSEE